MADPTKKCPYCAETIQFAAIVCRFCGAALAQSAPPVPAKPPSSSGGVMAVIALCAFVGAVVFWMWQTSKKPATASAGSATPYKIGEELTPPPREKTAVEEIREKSSATAAFVYARPRMTDEFNKHSTGTLLFAVWAMDHLQWPDVSVTKDETTHALVLKDPDEERGRRLCIGGTIAQIEKDRTVANNLFSGLLLSYGQKIYSFLAVGSTGSLVANSDARICGLVTGKYDYSNSAGGTGHAVDMVGMFQLPENMR